MKKGKDVMWVRKGGRKKKFVTPKSGTYVYKPTKYHTHHGWASDVSVLIFFMFFFPKSLIFFFLPSSFHISYQEKALSLSFIISSYLVAHTQKQKKRNNYNIFLLP